VEKVHTEFDLASEQMDVCLSISMRANFDPTVLKGIQEKTPEHFRGNFARTRSRARRPERTWLLLIFSLWTGSRARIGNRSCQRTRTLYANEFHESPVNRLTSSITDPVTHTPAFKEASVHMQVLPEIGESPLPRVNPRFGHPLRNTASRSSENGNAPIIIFQKWAGTKSSK